jgi:hypothetical protein
MSKNGVVKKPDSRSWATIRVWENGSWFKKGGDADGDVEWKLNTEKMNAQTYSSPQIKDP